MSVAWQRDDSGRGRPPTARRARPWWLGPWLTYATYLVWGLVTVLAYLVACTPID